MSSEGQRGDKVPAAFVERTLFRHPRLYQIKRFLIEDVIWGFLLSRVFRLDAHPLPDLAAKYAGRQVLVEFGIDMTVLLVGAAGPGGPVREFTVGDLVPEAFTTFTDRLDDKGGSR